MLLTAPAAQAISRDSVLDRAQSWADNPVKYSQSRYYKGYRTDCSGYVSMCWATRTSWSTSTFHAVTHRIRVSQLRPGDAMLKRGYHIRLFYGWLDEAHTVYVAYESGYGVVASVRLHSTADDLNAGYVPVRYDRIGDSSASTNVLRNHSFNTWARKWSGASEEPAWWNVSGPYSMPDATRRRDVYRTPRNSLLLTNPSSDPADSAEISQTASVAPGYDYTLSAWVRTPSEPSGLTLRIAYLDTSGATLAETSTIGSRGALDSSAFRQVSTHLTTPAGAVRAQVALRLSGGVTTDTVTGAATPGTRAFFDDVTLTRPRVAVGNSANRRTVRRGGSVTLSGSVYPASAAGANLSIYWQPPGRSWRRCGNSAVTASAGAAKWRGTFRVPRRGRRGTYRFRVVAPEIPGYLGATSRIVSVSAR